MTRPVILWLRRDLRLNDHSALLAAINTGVPVIPVYILDDDAPKHHKMGGASRWWLHHSLKSLDRSLRATGSRLILRRGNAVEILNRMIGETGASGIYFIHHHEPWWRNAERALQVAGTAHGYHGNYLLPVGRVRTGDGRPYKIYTPFWRALNQQMPPPEPAPAPDHILAPEYWPVSDNLGDWKLCPTRPDWATTMDRIWTAGEEQAARTLSEFGVYAPEYDMARNLPSIAGTSSLSPHLHFGEISASQIWHAMTRVNADTQFLKEIAWRDYAQNIIVQFPDYATRNARAQFDDMPWRDPASTNVATDLQAWQQGQTGYPIVDAGMRQLWATGWMHNRVRMITSSFLVKHLLIDWRMGEKWFWDTLVDADYASNAVNWQWVAGTGVDSNMFVRIMAPLGQSEKFSAGNYIRKWVPELAMVDDPYVHDPDEFGMRPKNYPAKIIGHRAARERALAAYGKMKSG